MLKGALTVFENECLEIHHVLKVEGDLTNPDLCGNVHTGTLNVEKLTEILGPEPTRTDQEILLQRRIYICGTPQFMGSVERVLINEMDIPSDEVVVLPNDRYI
jgi:ferredoxin-NADP reductase